MEHAAHEITWDTCRYLRNMEVLDIAARLYWVLIRYTTLNRLDRLHAEALRNARDCQNLCLEESGGTVFREGYEKLGKEIAHALDAFHCPGYEVRIVPFADLDAREIASCIALIRSGGALDVQSAKAELPQTTTLALARKNGKIVGIGTIKRERPDYAKRISQKSGVQFPGETRELGYVAVSAEHRGKHLSHCIARALLNRYEGRLFATTSSDPMKRTVARFGFAQKGNEWKGRQNHSFPVAERMSDVAIYRKRGICAQRCFVRQ